ncbi:hypothetical protein l13_02800 [Neisseria weaveri ATCC 51223]|nr:hypothetical protein l13_02800 [Neisseria weaveri ATCC 51223]
MIHNRPSENLRFFQTALKIKNIKKSNRFAERSGRLKIKTRLAV